MNCNGFGKSLNWRLIESTYMLLKTPSHSSSTSMLRQHGKMIAGLAVLLLLSLVAYGIQWREAKRQDKRITCSAETVKLLDGSQTLVSDGIAFNGVNTRSREAARTGDYSSKIDSAHTYGLGYTMRDAKAGERYRVSIWRRGNKLALSYLAVNIPSEPRFYKQEGTPVEVDAQDWERLELNFQIPASYAGEPISIYGYGGGRPVYLDDLSIERIPVSEIRKDIAEADSAFPKLEIRIGEAGMRKLKEKREEAIYRGILFSSDDDWVSANLLSEEANMRAKVRFKGDWMDHLAKDKWSFRIKLKAPNAWNRMLTFSVQNPITRDYLSEWVYHQLLDREGLLTTRYDFLHLSLNGDPKGIYAYEEHFEKHLVEYRARREGPIVKFSEQGVWQARKRAMDMERGGLEIEELLSSMEATHAEAFKSSSVFADTLLREQFDVAQALMHQYQLGLKPTSEVFDIEKMAKFYALTDLARAYHGLVWHNQRHYFNPIINKLEPIGYDGFTEEGIFPLTSHPFVGAEVNGRSGNMTADLLKFPFLDSAFMRRYIHYLDQFSQKQYVENFLMDIREGREARTQLIQQEFPAYSDAVRLPGHATRIRSVLFPVNHGSVKAFTKEKTATDKVIQLANFHLLPLEIIGWGRSEAQMSQALDETLWLEAHDKQQLPQYVEMRLSLSATHIFFQLPGSPQRYVSEIQLAQLPGTETPYQELFSDLSLTSSGLYRLEGKNITFLSGSHTIKEPILIPKGYAVNIPSGTSIDLVQGAFFMSQSPVEMIGGEESPIRIFSSDQSSQGFSVIEAGESSVLRWVAFEHLGTLNKQGWRLTGAVTFYESPVNIDRCSFSNNHCEDGLNVIRSDFQIRHSTIAYAYADGLDIDFSKGSIDELRVHHTGNDGLDFSGSLIDISSAYIEQAGDKGISVGEEATVNLQSATIQFAHSGVVAKDLSKLSIKSLSLSDCDTGFAAYQKKPEYGGATIRVEAYEAKNLKHLHLIEQGSRLWLKGKMVSGI